MVGSESTRVEGIYLAKPGCGICSGSPAGEPCHTNFERERVELPALAHADAFCLRALIELVKRTPTRIKKTSTADSWRLIDSTIKLSEAPVYKNEVKEWLDLAVGIAEHVSQRPYEGAEEQIQSRKILAYEPMFRDQYVYDAANAEMAMQETSRRLGRLLLTIDERSTEYYENDETGIAANQSAEIEAAYLLVSAGVPTYPASMRQDKSPVKRHNFDLYVHPTYTPTPIQIQNTPDSRTYDPSILTLNFKQFRQAVMSKSGNKERDYPKLVHNMMIAEATDDRAFSSAKLRPLNLARKHMVQTVAAHQEKLLKGLQD